MRLAEEHEILICTTSPDAVKAEILITLYIVSTLGKITTQDHRRTEILNIQNLESLKPVIAIIAVSPQIESRHVQSFFEKMELPLRNFL